MQTPINRHGVTFSHNIEILRDIADTIGIHNMAMIATPGMLLKAAVFRS